MSGGKGASLAKLTQAGFTVPPGVIVTAAGYRAFIAATDELKASVAPLDFEHPAVLHEQCAAIRSMLLELDIGEELADALDARLPALLAEGPVAVRSSSTLEDLAGAAFAGQHDTFLNVSGVADVTDAVKRCFASLWEDRAVRYRHERGFGQDAMSMAVVVQSMVESEVAGVAFSLNPITGDLSQLVVNSAYGLGETVVSGEGDVDQFVLDKVTGEVASESIAAKTHAIVGTPTGTAVVPVDQSRVEGRSLTAAQLGELVHMCVAVERFYAFPQDIEWALVEDRLYLLQSRPVTQFPARWTRDESAERFPNAITPLTWDFTSDGFHKSLDYSLGLLGMPAIGGKWFERFDGYVYGNQTAVQLYTGGQQVAFESLTELEELIPALRRRYAWVQELPIIWARDLDHYLLGLGRLGAVDLSALSDYELWKHIVEVDTLGTNYFRPNIAISITQGILHRVLYKMLAMLVGPEKAPALYDGLTAYCETKTNLVNRDIYQLYRQALAFPELAALLRGTERREIWESGGLDAFPAFREAFVQFLADHGHREVEYDAYHPTWLGQPWVVLENIRLMLDREEEVADPRQRSRELRLRQQRSDRELLNLLPEQMHFFASELLNLVRTYTSLDDLEHYQTTRLFLPFRAALVTLGGRLIQREVLEEPEDIFFLRKASLAELMDGDLTESAAAEEIAANKAAYQAQLETTPPLVWGEQTDLTPAEGDLTGLPGSPGVAEGPICLVRDVGDFPRFPAGAVLVARTTNPAWTPLFYTACAVITESGGPLSHGAVTAREVGVPAVMAVRNALTVLEEGESVRVNGTAGTVSRLTQGDP